MDRGVRSAARREDVRSEGRRLVAIGVFFVAVEVEVDDEDAAIPPFPAASVAAKRPLLFLLLTADRFSSSLLLSLLLLSLNTNIFPRFLPNSRSSSSSLSSSPDFSACSYFTASAARRRR